MLDDSFDVLFGSFSGLLLGVPDLFAIGFVCLLFEFGALC